MKDIIRKALLLGLGGYTYAKEGVDKFVKELEKDGKITPTEGKKLVDSVLKDGKKIADKQSGDLKKVVSDVLGELGVATKKDIERLEKSLKGKKK